MHALQIGGTLCSAITSNDTHITCTTPAHTIGEFDVQVSVDGKGRASGVGSFTYQLEINSISHCDGYVLNTILLLSLWVYSNRGHKTIGRTLADLAN